jgi:hypothetical protein
LVTGDESLSLFGDNLFNNLNLGAAGNTQRGQILVQVNLSQPVFFPII